MRILVPLKSLCAELFVTAEEPLYFRWLVASAALVAIVAPLPVLDAVFDDFAVLARLCVPPVFAAFAGSVYDISRVRPPGTFARIGACAAIVVALMTRALLEEPFGQFRFYPNQEAILLALGVLLGSAVARVTDGLRRWSWSERGA